MRIWGMCGRDCRIVGAAGMCGLRHAVPALLTFFESFTVGVAVCCTTITNVKVSDCGKYVELTSRTGNIY
jgi:hypothetical protein